jgi:3'-5' exoribonuclease
MNIIDFKENENINGTYLVTGVLKGRASNGSNYLSIKLQDATKDIDGKVWSATPEQMAEIVTGKLLYVEGSVIKYRDNLQLKIESSKLVDANEVDLLQYIKSAPETKEDLRNELQSYIYEIDDRIVNVIVSEIVKEYDDKLVVYPAASKNHHAYNSGLLFHTVSMLRLGKKLIELYPALNKNYLYAGIILHDLGKVEELSGVLGTEYTLKGKLMGHISIMSAKIMEVAKSIDAQDSEQAIMLSHLVLSHHGKQEYGSPVLPMSREAEMLSFIDNIDARMDTLDNLYDGTSEGEFTPRSFALENRSFYKLKDKKE